jgi:hypothetical protein
VPNAEELPHYLAQWWSGLAEGYTLGHFTASLDLTTSNMCKFLNLFKHYRNNTKTQKQQITAGIEKLKSIND